MRRKHFLQNHLREKASLIFATARALLRRTWQHFSTSASDISHSLQNSLTRQHLATNIWGALTFIHILARGQEVAFPYLKEEKTRIQHYVLRLREQRFICFGHFTRQNAYFIFET